MSGDKPVVCKPETPAEQAVHAFQEFIGYKPPKDAKAAQEKPHQGICTADAHLPSMTVNNDDAIIQKKKIAAAGQGDTLDAKNPNVTPFADRVMERVDRNKDGDISRDELNNALTPSRSDEFSKGEIAGLKVLKEKFNEIDQSLWGSRDSLSRSELKDFDAKQKEYDMQMKDAHNVLPNQSTLVDFLDNRAATFDGNKDGALNRKELEAALTSGKLTKEEQRALTYAQKNYNELVDRDGVIGVFKNNGISLKGMTERLVDHYRAIQGEDNLVSELFGNLSLDDNVRDYRNGL